MGGGHVFRFEVPWIRIHNVNTTHDTGRSFKLIFMKFIWLVRVHSWVNTIVWKQSALKNRRYGRKCASEASFLGLSQTVCGFLRKKLTNCIQYPISTPPTPQKVIFTFVVGRPVPLKNNFSLLFWKIMFFSKKLLNEKYSKPQCLQKRLY